LIDVGRRDSILVLICGAAGTMMGTAVQAQAAIRPTDKVCAKTLSVSKTDSICVISLSVDKLILPVFPRYLSALHPIPGGAIGNDVGHRELVVILPARTIVTNRVDR
jgi:hypothetical protein